MKKARFDPPYPDMVEWVDSLSVPQRNAAELEAMGPMLRGQVEQQLRLWPNASVQDCRLLALARDTKTRNPSGRYLHWDREMFDTHAGWCYYQEMRGPVDEEEKHPETEALR